MQRALWLAWLALACIPSVAAQEEAGYEYWISEAVHDSLAQRIVRGREARPDRGFYLIWRGYGGNEWGVELAEGPSFPCDSVRVATANRFLVLAGERFAIVPESDNLFGVSGRVPDPFDPDAPPRRIRSMCGPECPYTVRFNIRGEITAVENEWRE